jgi:DNA-nicking Smr family endonuclease
MAIATPSPSNDAALNAQLDITRDASIANLEQKSSEVQQQYRDEAAKIQDQQKRSAEVVQASIDAARQNDALKAEADFRQAVENGHAVENAVLEYINASPDGSKRINYNRLTGVPLHLEGDLIRTSQITLKARDAYLDTHPEERNNPMLQVHIGEDGFVKFGSELQEHIAIASPGVQANPNEPLVTFIDQPDGTFDAKLVTGETFRGFKANENRDAIRKIAESKVNTRRHYENLAQQQQPANGQQLQPQAQPPASESPSLTDWFLDETAKRFGYQNGAEMVADQNARYAREQQNNAVLEQVKNERTVQEFFANHPEYPNSDQANNALEQIINRNGWEWTPDTMAAAHALAVQNRVYQPLSQQEIAIANGYAPQVHRPTPPPIPRSSAADSQVTEFNLWTEPLDQLKKRISMHRGQN